jgi:hypothetical protein
MFVGSNLGYARGVADVVFEMPSLGDERCAWYGVRVKARDRCGAVSWAMVSLRIPGSCAGSRRIEDTR